MESLEADFLVDGPLMEPSMSLPLQHPGHHPDGMHLGNGSLDHGGLDALHDLSGGDEDYKRMLQMLVLPTLPTSSCESPSYAYHQHRSSHFSRRKQPPKSQSREVC